MDSKFITKVSGKEFVLYDGLVDEAHKKGLISIETEFIQLPSDDNNNVCIVKATAKTETKSFDGIGDATPRNVGAMILPHMIRMAETRAKARALRDLTNVGMCSREELA